VLEEVEIPLFILLSRRLTLNSFFSVSKSEQKTFLSINIPPHHASNALNANFAIEKLLFSNKNSLKPTRGRRIEK
jgi:hypothetical protein